MENSRDIYVVCYKPRLSNGEYDCRPSQEAYPTYEDALEFVMSRINIHKLTKFTFYDDSDCFYTIHCLTLRS